MQLLPKQNEFLDLAARAAVRAERMYGVPAELTVAQAVLESGWGGRIPGNNCLGIKASAHHPQCVVVATKEVLTEPQIAQWNRKHPQALARIVNAVGDGRYTVEVDDTFAAFNDLTGCFEEHAILLSQRAPYDAMLAKFGQSEDLPGYIERVAGTYATDPGYSKKLLAVMSLHPVQDALMAARKGAVKA